jgi:hypothetical protein
MWLGNVIMATIGVVLVSRMGRSTGNSRGGGGPGEWVARVVGKVKGGASTPRVAESTG